jgi:hydroxymethylglutaryl-CoA lyase
MFESMGAGTGLDFDKLIALRGRIGEWLKGESLHGAIWKAGLPRTMKELAHA